MNASRMVYFSNLTLDKKLALTPSDFTISEFKFILDEMSMREEARELAELRYIKCKTIEEIADIQGIDKRTCKNRLRKIDEHFKLTCTRIFAN